MNLLKNLVGVLGLLWLLAQWFPSKPPISTPVVAAKPFFTAAECEAAVQRAAVKWKRDIRLGLVDDLISPSEFAGMVEQKMRSRGLCAEK